MMILDFSAAHAVLGIEVLNRLSQTGQHALDATDQVARPGGHGPLYAHDAKVDAFYFYLRASYQGQSGISNRQREVPGIAVLDGASRIVTLHAVW